MVRLAIAALLTAALGACSHHENVPVVSGAPAGNVVEVTGTVTATGATGARTLRVGDTVTADDAIDTGTGSVAIVLAHNAARWELGPDHHDAKVRESPAWKLAKQDGVAKSIEVQTTPAGREAEHTAVDTVASTTTATKPETDERAEPPARTATPAPPPPTIQPTRRTEAPVVAGRSGGGPGGAAGPSDKGAGMAATKSVGSAHGASNPGGLVTNDRELRACLTAKAHLVIACATSSCTVTSSEVSEPVRACLLARLNAMKLADLSLTLDLVR